MEKLPSTSYVRLVDIWLIFGQLIPFTEVILLTLMELYNEEDDEINHHGRVRKVGPISQVSSQLQNKPQGLHSCLECVCTNHLHSDVSSDNACISSNWHKLASVLVAWHLGGQLATTLVATILDIIFFPSPFFLHRLLF